MSRRTSLRKKDLQPVCTPSQSVEIEANVFISKRRTMLSAGPQQQRPTRRMAFFMFQISLALLKVGFPAVSAQVLLMHARLT